MRLLIAAATCVARALYAVLKAVVPVRHKVVFLSRQSDAPSRDFVLLADALLEQDPGLEIVMSCRMVGAGPAARIAAAFATVPQMYHLATAEACVVDGYVIPVSLLQHRRGLFVVQMWHALGAIKKFGYQTVGRAGGHSREIASAMRMHRNYDLVLCGGPATVPVFAEAFGVDPAIVAPLGLPRIDYLLGEQTGRDAGRPSASATAVREAFPQLRDPSRTVVLYAPTLRKRGDHRYRDVAERFSDPRYTLIVKPHPLESARIEGANVVNAGGVDVLDLLPLCSAVITDYSAVAFEAAVIDIPVYFYVYDNDEYARDCGLNIDVLSEMPGAASRDLGVLAGRIEAGETNPEEMRRLKAMYVSAPAGCTARIADTILQKTRAS
jgi:CDP-ribitol ribitolphosphotransferase / teichoic acid ribitol-phosphate polymerase